MKKKDLHSEYKLLKNLDRLCTWKEQGIVYPILVGFNLTNACNNKCPLCTSQRKDNVTVDLNEAKDIICQLKDVDVKAIGLGGGGDPTCHPNLEEIIRFIKSKDIEVAVCTNGYKMSQGVIDSIVESCSWMRISLDADGPEMYRKTHGMKESAFYQVIDNLSKLVKKREEVRSNIVIGATYLIGKDTISGIYSAAKLCKDKGIDYIRFRPFFEWTNSNRFEKKDAELMFNELNRCKDLESDRFSISYPVDRCDSAAGKRKRTYPRCYIHHFNTLITPDLKLYPCCMLEDDPKYCLGSLKEKSFKEIWMSEKRKKAYSSINLADCPDPCMLEKHNEILNSLLEEIPHSNFL